jgi:hypothetical protein
MSREERRSYQRMMRDAERGPSLPPAAKARAERNAARRAARATPSGETGSAFTPRFWITTLLLAALIGYFGFSFQWDSGMPFAAYFGLVTGVVAFVILVAVRAAQRAVANR